MSQSRARVSQSRARVVAWSRCRCPSASRRSSRSSTSNEASRRLSVVGGAHEKLVVMPIKIPEAAREAPQRGLAQVPGQTFCPSCECFIDNKRLSAHNSICDGITRLAAASSSSRASAEVPVAPLPDDRSSAPSRLPLFDGSAPCKSRSLDPRQRHVALLDQLRSEPNAKASLRDLQFLKLASREALSARAVNELLRDEHRVRRPASNKHPSQTHRPTSLTPSVSCTCNVRSSTAGHQFHSTSATRLTWSGSASTCSPRRACA